VPTDTLHPSNIFTQSSSKDTVHPSTLPIQFSFQGTIPINTTPPCCISKPKFSHTRCRKVTFPSRLIKFIQ
ncbi:unnamed protein product, partial [Hymenolepis diminuta]